ncbi:MAG: hypothetical protein EA389_10165 [Ilumatobacter sp.]|nr:MAG: hypothetical protein EA389_10165 [Ilumatobacter sp.]
MTLRRWIPSVAVLVVTSLLAVGAVGASSAPGAAQLSDTADRSEIDGFLSDLESAVGAVQADPYLSAVPNDLGMDLTHSVATARTMIGELSDDELDQLEMALDAVPSIVGLPAAIDDAVAAAQGVYSSGGDDEPQGFARTGGWPLRSPTPVLQPGQLPEIAVAFRGTFTDDCATAGNVRELAETVLRLNLLQTVAYAAVVAVPGVFGLAPAIEIPNPVKIALAIIYGVAYAVYLAVAQTFEVALDCAETAQADEQALALARAGPPENEDDPAEGTVVRGSSQITVDEALDAVGDIGEQLVGVVENVGLVTGQVTLLAAEASSLNTTLSCTTGIPVDDPVASCGGEGQEVADGDALSRVTDVDGVLQAMQGDVAILRNTQHGSLDKANEEILALEEFAALQLRMEIEANLSLPGFHPVGLFQLPAQFGGHLEVVQAVTTEMVNAYGSGGNFLGQANAAFSAGQYKLAYSLYQQAYQGATK